MQAILLLIAKSLFFVSNNQEVIKETTAYIYYGCMIIS